MSKNVLTPPQVTASQVRTIMTSPRQYLYEQRVAASATNRVGQAIHKEISKSFKTKT